MKAKELNWWEGHTLELCISVFNFSFTYLWHGPLLLRPISLLSTRTPLSQLAPDLHLILAGATPPAFLPVFLVSSVISQAQKL